jgi:hypothetical protein
VHGVQAVAQLLVMAGEQVAVAVQGEGDRGVSGPDTDLLGVGPGGDPQRHRRVPQVVGTQRRQPGRPHRWQPDLDPEVRGQSLSKGSRAVIVGRLQQRAWTAEDGSARSVVEVLAEELGPSLRWATATPTRTSR